MFTITDKFIFRIALLNCEAVPMSDNIMLTIGALVLLSSFIITSNSIILENKRQEYESEYMLTAIGIAQSVIDEAKTKAFDEVTNPTNTSTLTISLAPESGESFTVPEVVAANEVYQSMIKYDDVDDYNGYSRTVNTPRAGGYNVRVSVNYVNETNPDTDSGGSRTFCKKMTVTVTSIYFSAPVRLYYAFIY